MPLQLPFTRLSALIPSSSPPQSTHISSQDYLIGLRGILTAQSFLFIFFQAFLPAAVANSKNITGPLYQVILRKTLSPLFWNESLIYSFIILLSARTLCLPYLSNPNREVCSSSIIRRGIRLFIPTFVAFSLSTAAFSITSTSYIDDFLRITSNVSTSTPLRMRTFLTYFNSLFDLFWLTRNYASQAASVAFPSGTLWVVSVLYQQSYTVYMTMIIIPHTLPSFRVKALVLFILTAWWVQSWAWYSITGLLLADAVLNMGFRSRAQLGWRIGRVRVPMWVVCGMLVGVGVVLQFLWVAWRPEYRNEELKGHTGLYNTGSLNNGVDPDEPQARGDNYLVILGVMVLVETYDSLQRLLRNRILVGMGRRSFSVFLAQPLVVYTAGIKLYLRLHKAGVSHEWANLICFVVCAIMVVVGAEMWYRIVDCPSVRVARWIWGWMRK